MSENNGHKVKSKVMALPNGFRGSAAVKVSVSFDDDQFYALRDYARNRGVSFGEAVRRHLTLPETHTEA